MIPCTCGHMSGVHLKGSRCQKVLATGGQCGCKTYRPAAPAVKKEPAPDSFRKEPSVPEKPTTMVAEPAPSLTAEDPPPLVEEDFVEDEYDPDLEGSEDDDED